MKQISQSGSKPHFNRSFDQDYKCTALDIDNLNELIGLETIEELMKKERERTRIRSLSSANSQ
jgi:nucleotidyltransferase/DNA polymerase involved in DNA repair